MIFMNGMNLINGIRVLNGNFNHIHYVKYTVTNYLKLCNCLKVAAYKMNVCVQIVLS